MKEMKKKKNNKRMVAFAIGVEKQELRWVEQTVKI